jgi:hypothetical protein
MKWLSRKYAAQGDVRGAQNMNFIKGTEWALSRRLRWMMQLCFQMRKEMSTNRVRGVLPVAGAAGAEFRRAENLDMAVLYATY